MAAYIDILQYSVGAIMLFKISIYCCTRAAIILAYCATTLNHVFNVVVQRRRLTMADSTNIVANSTAKSGVWVHFRFPGSPDGTILTKKRVVCRLCKQEMPYKNNTIHHRAEFAKLHGTASTLFNYLHKIIY